MVLIMLGPQLLFISHKERNMIHFKINTVRGIKITPLGTRTPSEKDIIMQSVDYLYYLVLLFKRLLFNIRAV